MMRTIHLDNGLETNLGDDGSLTVTDSETGLAVRWNGSATFRVYETAGLVDIGCHTLYGTDGNACTVGAAGRFAVALLAEYGA